MKGLLRKDYYTIFNNKKQFYMMLGMSVIFTFVFKNAYYFAFMMGIWAVTTSISTFSYDESSKWDTLASSFPVQRNKIVLSRYLSSCSILLISFLLSLITNLFVGLFTTTGFGFSNSLIEAFIVTCLSCLFCAFSFFIIAPVIYKLGAEKARYVITLIYMIPAVSVFLIFGVFWQNTTFSSMESALIIAVAIFACIILCLGFISYHISCKIYNKKEF